MRSHKIDAGGITRDDRWMNGWLGWEEAFCFETLLARLALHIPPLCMRALHIFLNSALFAQSAENNNH
jgi:hypothetical protein